MAGGPDYDGKPRPSIILQDDAFDATVDHSAQAIFAVAHSLLAARWFD